MPNPQFYVSGKRPMMTGYSHPTTPTVWLFRRSGTQSFIVFVSHKNNTKEIRWLPLCQLWRNLWLSWQQTPVAQWRQDWPHMTAFGLQCSWQSTILASEVIWATNQVMSRQSLAFPHMYTDNSLVSLGTGRFGTLPGSPQERKPSHADRDGELHVRNS